jgi:hypothetical protein
VLHLRDTNLTLLKYTITGMLERKEHGEDIYIFGITRLIISL